MKRIKEAIKLRKFKNDQLKEVTDILSGTEFLVWYKNNTCEEVYFKEDLIPILRNDNIKPIRYIFDMNDRIIIDRKIILEDDLTGGKNEQK